MPPSPDIPSLARSPLMRTSTRIPEPLSSLPTPPEPQSSHPTPPEPQHKRRPRIQYQDSPVNYERIRRGVEAAVSEDEQFSSSLREDGLGVNLRRQERVHSEEEMFSATVRSDGVGVTIRRKAITSEEHTVEEHTVEDGADSFGVPTKGQKCCHMTNIFLAK